jgi:glycosyltransferase involved in cell wall biosynthesis
MRILCVTPWFPVREKDTTGKYILDSVRSLAEYGAEFHVLVCEPWRPAAFGRLHADWRARPGSYAEVAGALKVECIKYFSAPRNMARQFARASFSLRVGKRVKELVASFRPDIIHGHTEITAELLAQTGAARRIPTVVTLHGVNTAPALQRPAYLHRIGQALSSTTRVVLVGEPLRAPFHHICGSDNHFRIIPNGFTPPQELPPPRRFTETPTRFISVSNLHEGKGIDINLRALAELRATQVNDWRYTVVGAGRELTALTTLARDLGLSDRVEFAGACPPDAVYGHLANADIFILPSYREAFGIAYLEAMASGLLTIGVSGQGPEAFIIDGVNGHLVPPRNVSVLKDLLLSAIQNPERSAALAREGQRTALDEFTWNRHAKKLLNVFEEALR